MRACKPWFFVCLLVCSSCSRSGGNKTAVSEDEGAPATPVQISVAQRQAIHSYVTAEGILYPLRQANITPKINAPVARFLVQRGDHVYQGQLLALLERRDLMAAAQESKQLYDQAQAIYENTAASLMPNDMTKAKADFQVASETRDAAEKVYESRLSLFRQGALAQKLVDDSKVALVTAESQLETARQILRSLETVGKTEQLKSAEAQMAASKAHFESSQAQASYAEIRSPMTGVVSDRPLNVGEMASNGSTLVSIVELARVVARASVPVQEASLLTVGKPATISSGALEAFGKVSVVSPAVDPNTTTVQVWVEAHNPGEHLKLGSTVQISVDAGEVPDAIVIPVDALLSSDNGGEKVMIAGSDNLAHEHSVVIGVRSGDNVQILSGVRAGDQVITQGALGLDDKARVDITKPGNANEEHKTREAAK